MIAEAAAYYADQDMTLWDALCRLFEKYGYHKEKVLNIEMNGIDAAKKMEGLMKALRESQIEKIGGVSVSEVRDYQQGIEGLPPADVLYYRMADGSVIIVRPSGTEPKMKIYIMTNASGESEAGEKIKDFEQDFSNRIKKVTG